jgi:hypothetical protein
MKSIEDALKLERRHTLEKNYDFRTALMACYDETLSVEERAQIWGTLNQKLALNAIATWKYWNTVPWPRPFNAFYQTWRWSRAQRASIQRHWEKVVPKLEWVVYYHMDRRINSFADYWGNQEEELLSRLTEKLQDFKLQDEHLSQFSEKELHTLAGETKRRLLDY